MVRVQAIASGNRDVKIELLRGPYGPLVGYSTSISSIGLPASLSHRVTQGGQYEVRVTKGLWSETPVSYRISIWFESRGTSTTTTTYWRPPSTTTTTITHSTTTTSTSRPPSTATPPSFFTDVSVSHPYYTQINALAAMGIISGYGDGTFRPDNPVFRQHFAKMIVRTLRLPVSQDDVCHFTDVVGNQDPQDPFYPDKYIAVRAAHGITEGKTPQASHHTRALSKHSSSLWWREQPPCPSFPELLSTSATSQRITTLGKKSALRPSSRWSGGHGGRGYRFWDDATRGEVCLLLHNLLSR